MNFIISHIYTEGNSCAFKKKNLDDTFPTLTIFYSIFLEIRNDFVKKKTKLSFFLDLYPFERILD